MERQELLERLARGEEEAWRQFLRDYGGLIYEVPARLGLHGAEREDIFQNVCVAVLRSIGSLRDPDRLATWLYGVAYRQSVNVLRRRGREVLAPADEDPARDLAARDPQPDARFEELEEAGLVRDSLESLEPRCRRLLSAIYLEDPPWSYQEISERHGMPMGSIGPTRARCLKRLRDRLGQVSGRTRRATSA